MMQTTSSKFPKITEWFKKNTEGTLLMQWISYFMIFSVLVIFILEFPTRAKLDWRFYATVLCLGMMLVMNILWFQYFEQLHIHGRAALIFHGVFNIVTSLLTLSAFAFTGSAEIIFLLFMQVAQFAMIFGVWPEGAIYSTTILGIALIIIKFYGETNFMLIQTATEFVAGIIFVLVIVLLESRSHLASLRAEDLLKDLQAADAALKEAQQREKELAIAEERMRLARDIHDGLGHHLTVLSIQLQAAEKLVERNPQAAAEALRVSRGEAQAALEEVRRSVGVMRQSAVESLPLVEMIASLVRDFSEHTGLKADFDQSGSPVVLSEFAGQTLFRTVQESLTNIQKHARGVQHIQVKLGYSEEAIHLVVSDDGRPLEEVPSVDGGYGLQGLRERVDQIGGTFFCGQDPSSGFLVEVSIPLQEVVRDQSSAGG